MPFKPGQSGNPNGKPKGSQNRDLKPIRERFTQLLDGYSLEAMRADLAEYLIPKLQRTTVQQEPGPFKLLK